MIKPQTKENSGQPQVFECVTANVTWAGLTSWLASQCLSWPAVTWSLCSRVVYFRVTLRRSMVLFCVLLWWRSLSQNVKENYDFFFFCLLASACFRIVFSAYFRVVLRRSIFFPCFLDIFPRSCKYDEKEKWKSSAISFPLFRRIAFFSPAEFCVVVRKKIGRAPFRFRFSHVCCYCCFPACLLLVTEKKL